MDSKSSIQSLFESSVILQDSKTNLNSIKSKLQFERSVILQDSKTQIYEFSASEAFESSVILQDSKTMDQDMLIEVVV